MNGYPKSPLARDFATAADYQRERVIWAESLGAQRALEGHERGEQMERPAPMTITRTEAQATNQIVRVEAPTTNQSTEITQSDIDALDAERRQIRAELDARRRRARSASPHPEIREACRRRMHLDGADAQALEGALSMAERERDAETARASKAERAAEQGALDVAALRVQLEAVRRDRDGVVGEFDLLRDERDDLIDALASMETERDAALLRIKELEEALEDHDEIEARVGNLEHERDEAVRVLDAALGGDGRMVADLLTWRMAELVVERLERYRTVVSELEERIRSLALTHQRTLDEQTEHVRLISYLQRSLASARARVAVVLTAAREADVVLAEEVTRG